MINIAQDGQPTWSIVLIAVYFVCLVFLAFFSTHRYLMLFLYYKRRPSYRPERSPAGVEPPVTIQLPIYNERYVVERLIDSVGKLDYPADKLQIQVLDDSTDETCGLARSCVERLRNRGVNIEHIRRGNRIGYKAGALQEGLKTATGEFVAIFDADFVPPFDFLRMIMHKFAEPRVAMVQMRWGHLNRQYSLLTKLQSIMLDAHFVIEHSARHSSGRFFNFNGTAGVWRKSAIFDAGGWQHDTLTEDLDLSYRAQLRGWKFEYLPAVIVPAELPVEINAFKSQQHRWTKGAVQTAVKLLPRVIVSRIPLYVKMEAIVHLTNNLAYLLMLVLSLMMLPVLLVRESWNFQMPFWVDLLLFFAATVSVVAFYTAGQAEIRPLWYRQLHYIPLMMSLGIGLCVINAKAVMEGLLGIKSGFVRTPKMGDAAKAPNGNRALRIKSYFTRSSGIALAELALAIYYACIVVHCITHNNYYALPFMLLFLFGFGYVGFLSLASMIRLPFTRAATAA
ncbi:MAG: cellulose synthase family protein [bacterium]|nr:glycosyltransferase family 2 protein [Candidatus Sumerlaeota bacterium]